MHGFHSLFYFLLISCTGTLLLVPLLSGFLKVPDGVLGIVSLLGNMGSSLTTTFATSSLMMYLCNFDNQLSSEVQQS